MAYFSKESKKNSYTGHKVKTVFKKQKRLSQGPKVGPKGVDKSLFSGGKIFNSFDPHTAKKKLAKRAYSKRNLHKNT
jgi:hypothetical protein